MKKIGVIVNPIAGIGGRVGLKGSDGEFIQKRALALGAQPEALRRTADALKILHQIDEPFELITCPDQMGELAVKEAGFVPTIIGERCPANTTAADTERAATEMMLRKVDLILFAGGDGTARNIYSVIEQTIPVLGIPAGVKIHSGVYAVNPKGAGQTVVQFLAGKLSETREAEVMDLDEEAYRQGRVSAKLYGYMKVPANTKRVQSVKVRSHSEASRLNGISDEVVSSMEPDTLYIIGPGTTTRRIMERLGLNNTLIGVDVICNGKLIANDICEQYLWHLVENKPAQIVITAIGGQGHILGRGNQQISPRIINKVGIDNIRIVATKEKLLSIYQKRLLVDTGDSALNEALCGFKKVITGYRESTICRVAN
ncbi:ATP-NAD kinase family protein [Photobacterium kagoshimensis]|uniref:ATP-NAD kinase family protein n=1 Tax=Photobacterium kagoshimensis TaxID=2910242 RepID=UPI003D0D042D